MIKSRIIALFSVGSMALVLTGAGCSTSVNDNYPPGGNETTTPGGTTTNTTPGTTSTTSTAATSTSSGNVRTVSAKIQNYSFQPQTITIKAGSTVIWTNKDSVGHTVTADDGSFGSSLISKDQTYSRKFDVPGTYSYHCTPHPNMKAKIIVQ